MSILLDYFLTDRIIIYINDLYNIEEKWNLLLIKKQKLIIFRLTNNFLKNFLINIKLNS